MSSPTVHIADTDAKIAACFPVMHELRPHLKDAAELVQRVKRQQQEGFVLAWAAGDDGQPAACIGFRRSEEHTSELQSLMRISYAVFCLKKKKRSSKSNRYAIH